MPDVLPWQTILSPAFSLCIVTGILATNKFVARCHIGHLHTPDWKEVIIKQWLSVPPLSAIQQNYQSLSLIFSEMRLVSCNLLKKTMVFRMSCPTRPYR